MILYYQVERSLDHVIDEFGLIIDDCLYYQVERSRDHVIDEFGLMIDEFEVHD